MTDLRLYDIGQDAYRPVTAEDIELFVRLVRAYGRIRMARTAGLSGNDLAGAVDDAHAELCDPARVVGGELSMKLWLARREQDLGGCRVDPRDIGKFYEVPCATPISQEEKASIAAAEGKVVDPITGKLIESVDLPAEGRA